MRARASAALVCASSQAAWAGALKSPTVSKLFGDEAYAVETVVPKTDINTLIPALKDHGATDFIEFPIAKIVH